MQMSLKALYLKKKHSKDLTGLTLTELMIAVFVSGITMYAIGSFMLGFFQNNQRLSTKIEKTVGKRVASKYFVDFAELAGASSQYMHLPTQICTSAQAATTAQPCIRWLRDDMRFTNYVPGAKVNALFATLPNGVNFTNPTLVTGKFMEFFRDDYGSPALKVYGTNSRLLTGADVPLTNVLAAAPIYATWVLQDDTSTPFLSLAHKKIGGEYITFENELNETNNPGICSGLTTTTINSRFASAGNYVLGTLSLPTAGVNGWMGNIVLVFNASDPSHYFFQVITNIIPCNWGGSPIPTECTQAWNAYTNNATPPLSATRYDVVIKMISVPQFNNLFPQTPATAYSEVAASTDFTNQTSGTSFFPSLVTSFFEQDGGGARLPFFGPANGVGQNPVNGALTLSSHTFRQCSGDNVQFMLMPVEIKAFYILKDSGSAACGTQGVVCSLNMGTYNNTQASSLRLVDKLDGSVVIGRKLGGKSLNFFTYDGFGAAAWWGN